MSFGPDALAQRLAALEQGEPPDRYLVAYSGGLDSTALLHALAAARAYHGRALVAVHVNHGLHAAADDWERHCRRFARGIGAAFVSRRVALDPHAARKRGVEAAARSARYAALRAAMVAGDVLLSAHHLEDQAETVLLNLMRGSGLAGIAAIAAARALPPGRLFRPLLDVPRAELAAYARRHRLEWLDDPSNLDTGFDRNYLRHEILPRLRQRWPAAAAQLKRSAELAAEAAALQDELGAIDYAAAAEGDARLGIAALRALPAARQRNVLRYALRTLGLPVPPQTRLRQVLEELVPARPDARPLVRWPGAEVRRYRGRIYLLGERPLPACAPLAFDERGEVHLGAGQGFLFLEAEAADGLAPQLAAQGLEVRFRQGGEKIRPVGTRTTRPLKKLLQEEGIVPWMRDRLPLVYAGGRLVAVADLWLAADAVASPGCRVVWQDRPALF